MAKSETKKSITTNKVFDVHRPGSSVPDASSKPVIVGHKNMLKDPMVKPGEEAVSVIDTKKEDDESSKEQVISNTAPTIQPPDEDSIEKAEAPDKTNDDSVTAEEVSENVTVSVSNTEGTKEPEKVDEEKPEEEPQKATKPEADEVKQDESDVETEEPEDDDSSKGNDEAEVAAVAEQVEQQKIDVKKQKVDEEKRAAMEKLAVEKKYYVPIGEKKRKRSALRIFLLILLLILLGALLFNVLIDVGFIDVNIDPPIKFINS